MAGTNDFKAFATDANANVTSQEEWETLTALKKGFSSGKASSAQVSKALRQPSTMAAVLGQFIANAELDALDDGDVDGLVAKLATAITTNLGLGEAAKRDVGTGENQIPDINSFLSVTGAAGYQKLPSGLIIQWGSATAGVGATGNTGNAINFSVSFPNICHQVVVSYDNGGGKVIAGAAGSFTKTNFLMRCDATSGVYVFRWFAIGS
ncbi:TPA: hypothetical protein ACGQMI_002332 [Escherichia coli]